MMAEVGVVHFEAKRHCRFPANHQQLERASPMTLRRNQPYVPTCWFLISRLQSHEAGHHVGILEQLWETLK